MTKMFQLGICIDHSVSGNHCCFKRLLWDSMVATWKCSQHLWPSFAARGKPLDMPWRWRFLQCFNHMGSCGSTQNVCEVGRLPRVELVFPCWLTCSCSSMVAVTQIPQPKMDQAHPHAHYYRSYRKYATS